MPAETSFSAAFQVLHGTFSAYNCFSMQEYRPSEARRLLWEALEAAEAARLQSMDASDRYLQAREVEQDALVLSGKLTEEALPLLIAVRAKVR